MRTCKALYHLTEKMGGGISNSTERIDAAWHDRKDTSTNLA